MPHPDPLGPAHGRGASHLSRRDLIALGAALASGSLARRVTALPPQFPPTPLSPGPRRPLTTTVVSTPDGKLRGELLPSGIRSFRGLRFAEPPTGKLRFRPPVPAASWTGTRDALAFAPAAMQPGDRSVRHSEDCLFLNIWTPPSPGPHPVFVWIHGGGYTGGNSFAPIFDGVSFARDGIVLVSVAYRLGLFGFLDFGPLLGSAYAGSGNNAIRDVIESLRWVQRNIASFGGDPARVTVGGESAGAKLTATLMALPEAQPLFHSAISESGGGERVLTATQAAGVAQRFAEQYQRLSPSRTGHARGSSSGNSGALSSFFETLLTADPLDLLTAQERTVAASPLHFPFRPEVDGAFLRGRPVDLVGKGSARGKRLLIGTNRDESALFLGPHPAADPTARDLGNLSVEKFALVLGRYSILFPDMPADLRRVRATSAEEYWVPSVRLADAQSRNAGPTWMYRLDFSPATGRYAGESVHAADLDLVWSHFSPAHPAPAQTDTGARSAQSAPAPEHARDPNAQTAAATAPPQRPTAPGSQTPAAAQQDARTRTGTPAADPATLLVSDQMHTAWCAFIRGEAPSAPGLPAWPAYTPETRATMLLDRTSRVEDRPAESELRLWDGVL